MSIKRRVRYRYRPSRTGLFACSGIRTYFSENYEPIWTVVKTLWMGDRPDARPT